MPRPGQQRESRASRRSPGRRRRGPRSRPGRPPGGEAGRRDAKSQRGKPPEKGSVVAGGHGGRRPGTPGVRSSRALELVGRPRVVGVVGARKRDGEGEEVGRVHAPIGAVEGDPAPHQEPGHEHHHQAQRDLARDQGAAKQAAPAARTRARRRRGAGRAPRRADEEARARAPKSIAVRNAMPSVNRRTRPVEPHLLQAGQRGGRQGDQGGASRAGRGRGRGPPRSRPGGGSR